MVIKVQFYNITPEGAILQKVIDLVLWPSGLRRQVKVLVSSEARVRTPRVSTFGFVFSVASKPQLSHGDGGGILPPSLFKHIIRTICGGGKYRASYHLFAMFVLPVMYTGHTADCTHS